jgi:hypothetical protein
MASAIYVWYPHGKHIGHCSMHIGQHREPDSDEWYVSWWPHKSTVLATRQGVTSTFQEDKDTEGGSPHVKYLIYEAKCGLHVGNMKVEWDAIRGKEDAHYKLLSKNCSTTVARVLRAGGLAEVFSGAQMKKYGTNLYWTPKDIARICDQLVAGDNAKKEKHHACPLKSKNIGNVIMGLR